MEWKWRTGFQGKETLLENEEQGCFQNESQELRKDCEVRLHQQCWVKKIVARQHHGPCPWVGKEQQS